MRSSCKAQGVLPFLPSGIQSSSVLVSCPVTLARPSSPSFGFFAAFLLPRFFLRLPPRVPPLPAFPMFPFRIAVYRLENKTETQPTFFPHGTDEDVQAAFGERNAPSSRRAGEGGVRCFATVLRPLQAVHPSHGAPARPRA
jgi:hypothetical protein